MQLQAPARLQVSDCGMWEKDHSMYSTNATVKATLKALPLPCVLQIIPEQGITPLFNHLNSSTSWFPALGKVRHSATPLQCT